MSKFQSLSTFISDGKSLTAEQIDSAMEVFGKRCRDSTKIRLRYALGYVPDIPTFGIYGRVHIEGDRVSYCAGQEYPSEVALVRDLLIGRK